MNKQFEIIDLLIESIDQLNSALAPHGSENIIAEILDHARELLEDLECDDFIQDMRRE